MTQEQYIYIDNDKVAISDLSDRQKYLVSQVTDINAKIYQLQLSADQLNIALTSFSQELLRSRANDDIVPDAIS